MAIISDDEFRRLLALLRGGEAAATLPTAHLDDQTIAAYIDAELAGQEAAARDAVAAAHLAVCPACQTLYTHALAYRQAEDAGQVSNPPRTVTFHPPRPTATSAPHTALWQRLEANVRRLVGEVTLQMQNTQLVISDLPALLQPYHVLRPLPAALRTRAENRDMPELREEIDLQVVTSNLHIRLSPSVVQAGKALLRIQLEELSTQAPLEGVRITLMARRQEQTREGQTEMLAWVTTGEDGDATFKQLQPGSYRIQIDYDDPYQMDFAIVT